MKPLFKRRLATLCAATLIAAQTLPVAAATDYSKVLTPAKPGMALGHPIAKDAIAPPPFSLLADRPVKPAYVASLPGLPQNRTVSDDFGRKPLKSDGVFIRKSRVENGEVVIPAGGLMYLEDTWGGEVALRGELVPVLGRMPTYIDYDMTIEVKENVTIPAGGSVAVGGTVYHYAATVGHQTMANHALHVRTIAGTDWEWAFGAPVLSSTETGWWNNRFTQLYNQGQASEVNAKQMTFDWISGIRMDRVLYADEKVFTGLAGAGDSWQVGARTVRVGAIDEKAGTVTIEVLENGQVKNSRVVGPIDKDLLIEDTTARKKLVFEDGDMVAFLSPWPNAFEGGKANLKVYGKAFSLRYGDDYAGDKRFAVYPVGCPTGHNFGFMLVNKEEIRLKPGQSVTGPEGYFKVVVDRIDNGKVAGWHVEDKAGARTPNLGGPTIENIDLVLGQGRVAGQAILKDVGRAMLARNYEASNRLSPTDEVPPQAAGGIGGLSPALLGALVLLLVGGLAVGFELGRRRKGNAA